MLARGSEDSSLFIDFRDFNMKASKGGKSDYLSGPLAGAVHWSWC